MKSIIRHKKLLYHFSEILNCLASYVHEMFHTNELYKFMNKGYAKRCLIGGQNIYYKATGS